MTNTYTMAATTALLPVAPAKAPQLTALADACNDGACNLPALIRSFGAAIEDVPIRQVGDHPAVKCILGHLSFLCGESVGPSSQAWQAYKEWRVQ